MSETLLEPDAQKVDEALAFISSFSSVVLSSVTKTGEPHASYAPYVTDAGKFYIYVSGLAQHASTLTNGAASLFFIENEQQAKTIFARRRLTISCRVSEIGPDMPHYERLLETMQARHGSTLKILRTLPDFILLELSPGQASFVTGFGAAYDLTKSLAELKKAAI